MAFVSLCLTANTQNTKQGVFTAWETAHVCPGLSMMENRGGSRNNIVKQIYEERSVAQCYHLNGNLELDVSSKDLMDAFYHGTVAQIRLSNSPNEYLWLDLYGLSYIGGNQLWGDKCHFVVEYMADDPKNAGEMKAGLMSETLDLTNLTFCSVIRKKSEIEQAPHQLTGPIVAMKTFTASDGNGGVGVRIKGMFSNGTLIFNQTTDGNSGGYMQVHNFNSECLSKGRTSMIDNHFRLNEPATICCPDYCDHGCFFEVDHAKRPGTPRWRCSKCKPDDDGNPRFWNDVAGTCDQCNEANRLGIICNTVNEQACPVPLVKTNGQCALECPWGETLNMIDGSCIPCEWSYQSATKMFGNGQDGCDITCAVFNSVAEATTTGLKRYRKQHFVGSEAQECRILTGNMNIYFGEDDSFPGNKAITEILNKLSVFYGKIRASVQQPVFFQSAQQIVGDVVVSITAPNFNYNNAIYFNQLQRFTGKILGLSIGHNIANTPMDKNTKEARKRFEQSGLIWTTALMEQPAVCYHGCKEKKCGPGPSLASWACKDCAGYMLTISEINLFSCVETCPIGFVAIGNSCRKCRPNCVEGCTINRMHIPSDDCNKCVVYVSSRSMWECKMTVSRPRCDGSEKCEGKLKGQIEKMIAALKEFKA
ncbi:hypothetical protein M3Y98_00701700 [Aphelenchoides besseyi]|nr:hypothetical protein M3Y98_00701700 [Aphelenchoides besseyi]